MRPTTTLLKLFRAQAFFSLACLILLLTICPNLAQAKNWTITQRQEALTREVNHDQKSGELTLKEANDLRSRLSDVTTAAKKMKEKNGGKLSYKDQGKLERRLNDVSVDKTKWKLEKRVAK